MFQFPNNTTIIHCVKESCLKYKTEIILSAVILGLSLITRFVFWGYPAEVVFDEVYFGEYANSYESGEYYYNLHPPLGAELIALGGSVLGYQGELEFEKLGDPYKIPSYKALRFAPTLAGSLIPLMIFMLGVLIGTPTIIAFVASMALVFDNALIVQSRFMMPDVFLILFAVCGLGLFLYARKHAYEKVPLVFSALLLSASFSVKWSAVGFIVAVIIITVWDFVNALRQKSTGLLAKKIALGSLLAVIAAVVVYFAVFQIHFTLLPKNGPGDAFMSEAFNTGEKNVLAKIVELNKMFYATNMIEGVDPHDYQSKFYSWPLMTRPVFYWLGGDDTLSARIYLLGNIIVWWGSSLGVLFGLWFWKPKDTERKYLLYLIYFSSLAPYIFVGRTLFLYHYLPSLVIAVMIASSWFFESQKETKGALRAPSAKIAAILVLILACFLYFSPLTYGIPQTESQFESRVWFPSWR